MLGGSDSALPALPLAAPLLGDVGLNTNAISGMNYRFKLREIRFQILEGRLDEVDLALDLCLPSSTSGFVSFLIII
jgi:hypothetical protein